MTANNKKYNVTLDQIQMESLLDLLETSKELCGKAVSSAACTMDFPNEADGCLLASARAFNCVLNLVETFKEYAEIP